MSSTDPLSSDSFTTACAAALAAACMSRPDMRPNCRRRHTHTGFRRRCQQVTGGSPHRSMWYVRWSILPPLPLSPRPHLPQNLADNVHHLPSLPATRCPSRPAPPPHGQSPAAPQNPPLSGPLALASPAAPHYQPPAASPSQPPYVLHTSCHHLPFSPRPHLLQHLADSVHNLLVLHEAPHAIAGKHTERVHARHQWYTRKLRLAGDEAALLEVKVTEPPAKGRFEIDGTAGLSCVGQEHAIGTVHQLAG